MANYNRSSLVLSVNRALWGEIGAELRQVTATIAHGALIVRFVFAETPSSEDQAMAERVTASVGKDFPEITAKTEIMESGKALVVEDGWNRIYLRRE